MKQLDELHKQMANLVDMCADGDISREVFRSKKKKLEDQISNIEKINGECRQQILGKLSENPRLFNCRDESVTKLDHIFPNIWLYFLVFVLHYMNEREINTLQNFCM